MLENILAYEIEEKYNSLSVNNEHMSFWYIREYLKGSQILMTLGTIMNKPDASICFVVHRVNTGEFLKKINGRLALFKSENNKKGTEQVDIDILNKYINDARQMRYIIQVENEDIFEVSTIIKLRSCTEKDLLEGGKLFQNQMYADGISVYPMNFNQYGSYKEFLPILTNNNTLYQKISKIFTTSSLTSLFMFYSESLMETDGLYFGEFSNKACMINLRKKEVNNSNILIVGSSGTGKSFLVKDMILQYLYKGIKQIVIDPEGEYVKIAKRLGQRVVSRETFNIMEIEEQFANSFGREYIDRKIDNLSNMLNLKNILGDDEKINNIKGKIKEIYHEHGITENPNSLYVHADKENIYFNKKYINKSKFPLISELSGKLANIKLSKAEKQCILQQIELYKCKISYDEDEDEDLIVYNLEKYDEDYVVGIMYKLQEYLMPDYIIYIDEMWRLIFNNDISLMLINLFKTIRKRGASIVAITQDISDIVSYNNGNFGKSIFNNSYTKIFFKTEYLDLENLQKIIFSTEEFYNKITRLKRGSALVEQGGVLFELNIVAFPQDMKIIEGEEK